ncbi:MAG: EmrB/QacA family drug resistance transporter, partial [Chloroflexi bacterium]|nr:EmrB/QacA family drug resistance transporter [Chloroflexota bacterium]
SFGTAVFGAIFSAQLAGNLLVYLSGMTLPAGFDASAGANPAVLALLPPDVHAGYVESFSASLQTVFLLAVPIAALAFVVSLFLPEVPLRHTSQATDPADTWAPTAKPATRSSLEEVARALGVLMSRDARLRMYGRLGARAGLDLDPRLVWMLLRLYEAPDGRLQDIAQHCGVPLDGLQRLADALCDRGLGCRETDSRGEVHVRLTETGRHDAQALVDARRAALSELVADWSPEQHADLAELLNRLARHVAEEPVPTA